MKRKIVGVFVAIVVMSLGVLPLSFGSASGEANMPLWSIGNYWEYNTTYDRGVKVNGTERVEVVGTDIIIVNNTSYDVYVLNASCEMYGNGTYIEDPHEYSATMIMNTTMYLRSSDLATVKAITDIEWNSTYHIDDMNMSYVGYYHIEATYEPPEDYFQFPIEVGKKWTTTTTMTMITNTTSITQYNTTYINETTNETKTTNYTCLGMEIINIPAGSFDAYKIEINETGGNYFMLGNYSLCWYSPTIGYMAKYEMWNETGYKTTSSELLSYSFQPNNLPVASNLIISPLNPTTNDDLTGGYDYYDEDDDPESGTEIRWYKDGVLQSTYNDMLTVPYSATSKGEVWYFTVKPKDGIGFGSLQTSPSITIVNIPPTVNITHPLEGQTVNSTITITGITSDPDNDIIEKVEIKIDEGDWDLAIGITDYPYAEWIYEWNTTLVPNGWHTIYARAYDGLNYSDIKAVNVNVLNPITVQVFSETITGANITAGYTGYGEMNVTVVVSPPQTPPELIGIGIYVNVTAPETIGIGWLYIEVPYNESLLPQDVKEENLRLYCWNETSGKWESCANIGTTGVDTINKIVWANVTHLTIFAPMSEKTAEAPAPSTNLFLYIGIAVITAIIVLAAAGLGIKRRKKASPPEKPT